MCLASQSSHFSDQAAEVVSQPQRQRRKEAVGKAENPGNTTFVGPPYHLSTPQGLGHQSSKEMYNHNVFNTSKGFDNDFIFDYSSNSSVDNEHIELEKDVDR